MRIALKSTFAAGLVMACIPVVSAFAAPTTTIDGWIADSKCGATHGAKSPDPDCVAKCIKGGAKPVFVDADNKVWAIDDPDAVVGHYGHHVTVMATVDSSASSVHITKVTMLPDQGK